MSSAVRIYVTTYCPYCDMAKRLLDQLGVPWEAVDVTHEPELRKELVARSGMRTVPQIFVGDVSVGGFTDLQALHAQGGLLPLLDAQGVPHP